MDKTDEGLLGNEKIEDAIAALQQQPTQELLAHALTVVRRRMRENGRIVLNHRRRAKRGSRTDETAGCENFRRKQLVGGFYQFRRRIETERNL